MKTSSGSMLIAIRSPTSNQVVSTGQQLRVLYYPNDLRRYRLRTSLPIQRRAQLSTVKESSERQSIKIDVPGRLGNNGGARAARAVET